MKDILKTLILLSFAVAGCQAWASESSTACGDETVRYTVSSKPKGSLPPTAAGQAQLVIIASVRDFCNDCANITTRAAIDGSWIGANEGNTYFVTSIAPGTHQICTDWQRPVISTNETRAFRAETGKTYYFLVQITRRSEKLEMIGSANERFTMQQIPEAKARRYLADAAFSVPEVYQ